MRGVLEPPTFKCHWEDRALVMVANSTHLTVAATYKGSAAYEVEEDWTGDSKRKARLGFSQAAAVRAVAEFRITGDGAVSALWGVFWDRVILLPRDPCYAPWWETLFPETAAFYRKAIMEYGLGTVWPGKAPPDDRPFGKWVPFEQCPCGRGQREYENEVCAWCRQERKHKLSEV